MCRQKAVSLIHVHESEEDEGFEAAKCQGDNALMMRATNSRDSYPQPAFLSFTLHSQATSTGKVPIQTITVCKTVQREPARSDMRILVLQTQVQRMQGGGKRQSKAT